MRGSDVAENCFIRSTEKVDINDCSLIEELGAASAMNAKHI